MVMWFLQGHLRGLRGMGAECFRKVAGQLIDDICGWQDTCYPEDKAAAHVLHKTAEYVSLLLSRKSASTDMKASRSAGDSAEQDQGLRSIGALLVGTSKTPFKTNLGPVRRTTTGCPTFAS